MKSKVTLLDLDGCICDDRHRIHLAQQKRWSEYHSLCHKDMPMNLGLIIPFLERYPFIVVTGRHDTERDKTHSWLMKNGLPVPRAMLMRTEKITESSPAMKKAWAMTVLKYYEIAMAFDDDQRIIDVYSSIGINCIMTGYDKISGVSFTRNGSSWVGETIGA